MQKAQTVCLVILTSIAVGFSLYYLKTVLLPFVIALFIMIGCRPVIEFLEAKLSLGRYVAFAIAFAIGSTMLVLFSLFTWLSINDLQQNSGRYEANLEKVAETVTRWMGPTSQGTDVAVKEGDETASENPSESSASDLPDDTRQALNEFFDWATRSLQAQIPYIASSLSSLLSYSFLILIFVFFLLLGQETQTTTQPKLVREMEDQIRRYLVMKTAISAVTGFAFGAVLWFFGIPLATLFGLLAFLLNFIPNIGPMISVLTPLPFIILEPMSTVAKIACFVLLSAIQLISGNVIETRMMGKSFDVSPVALLLALMFFGLVWGIVGMFLATPIVSILKISLQQNEATRPLGELLAGRWSTTEQRTAGV